MATNHNSGQDNKGKERTLIMVIESNKRRFEIYGYDNLSVHLVNDGKYTCHSMSAYSFKELLEKSFSQDILVHTIAL